MFIFKMAAYPFLLKNRVLFQLILALISILIALFTENFAIFGLTLLFFIMGIFITNKLNGASKDAVSIFSFFFLVYYLYAFITDYVYINDFKIDFFYALDSTKFFGLAYDLNGTNADLESYLFEYRFSFGYGYLAYALNYLTNFFYGYPTIFLHKIHIVFISSSVITYTYVLAKKVLNKIDKKTLFNYVIVFGFLSHFFVFSAILIRDLHIVYLYLVSFIVLTRKNNFYNLILLVLLCFLTFEFRVANGVFSLLFIVTFFYKSILKIKNKSKKNILTVLVLFVSIGLLFSISNLIDISNIEAKAEGYSEYHDQMLKEGSGFAKAVYNLPIVIRPFIFIFLSQITPLPATQAVFVNTIKENQILLFPLVLSVIFWIYVDIIIIINIYKKKIYKNINPLLRIFGTITVVFLVVTASTSPEFRRLLPVYPIIYLYFIFIYNKLSSNYKKNALTIFIIIYILLSLFILYLK